jgi:selenium metabolism protein YedF
MHETIIIINSETMGRGNDELGTRLTGSFLRKLCASEKKPCAVIFYNSAVKLLARGSTVLDAMENLSAGGVDLVACGTCVSFYGLGDSIHAGRVSSMQEIVSMIMDAKKVVTI